MRRIISVVLMAVGGWLLMAEPLVAFIAPKPDEGVPVVTGIVILICLVMAAVPLGIGVAVSPGDRRRELGLTILIAVGFAAFAGVSVAAVFLDPGFKPFMPLLPPMPSVRIAPVAGVVNLAAVTALGWLLYRGRRAGAEVPRR